MNSSSDRGACAEQTVPVRDEQAHIAAQMAGEWWASKLHPQHAAKREAFRDAVARRVEQALNGEFYWVWGNGRKEGSGEPCEHVSTENDYDPQGLLLEAVREVIDPTCRGCGFSGDGILPQKHSLDISRRILKPKEGYGNWTDDILVPRVRNGPTAQPRSDSEPSPEPSPKEQK